MIHIAGADWTKRVEICDDSINVRKISVFSNQKTVELIHNGKSLGVREVVNWGSCFRSSFYKRRESAGCSKWGTFRQAEDTDEIVIFPSY